MTHNPNDSDVVVAVVEDDLSILDAVTLVLEDRGWRARPYATGEAFLTDYGQGAKCDCLLLDPHLPGISGVEVAHAMAGSGVPILVVTARPDSPLTRTLVHDGASAVIVKPVSAGELVERIEQLLPRPAEV